MDNRRNKRIDGIKAKRSTSSPRRSISREPIQHIPINKKSRVNAKPKKVLTKKVEIQRATFKSSSTRKTWHKQVLRILIPVVLALLFVVWMLNQLDSAIVRVAPHRELVSLQETITAHRDPLAGELGFSIIAFSETARVSLNPDTQEQSRERASGTIKVFNDYSEAPQRLAPETRFQAVDGKVFRTGEQELIVPGKKNNIPGEVIATVYADQPGGEYNIDVTDFSIPGFLDLGLNEKYAGMYALSTNKFTGGYSGMKPAISAELKETQGSDLELKVQTVLQERLLTEKTPGMLFIENSASIVFKEPSFIFDAEEQNGTLSVTGTLYALLINREELGAHLSAQVLEMQEGTSVELSTDTHLVPVYSKEGLIDYSNVSTVDLDLDNDALYVWNIEEDLIKESFKDTYRDDTMQTIQKLQQVGSVTLTNHPRWRKQLPSRAEDISIRVR